MTLTPKQVEQNATQAAQLEALAASASDLARITRLNLSPMNHNLLWAEWHYLKALYILEASDDIAEWFDEACANLSVDAEGEPIDHAATAIGDDRPYKMARDEAV